MQDSNEPNVERLRYVRRRGLSGKQHQALPLELVGKSVREIAAAVDVAEGTIRNWRSQDQLYGATLNMLRREQLVSNVGRSEQIDALALDTIGVAINQGDAAIALKYHAIHVHNANKTAGAIGSESPAVLATKVAENKVAETLTVHGKPDSTYGRAVRAAARELADVDTRWEREALEAFNLSLRAEELLDGYGEIHVADFMRIAVPCLSSACIALDLSEGEGIRARLLSPGQWQRDTFALARRISAVISRRDEEDWREFDYSSFYYMCLDFSDVTQAIVAGLLGPDAKLPPLDRRETADFNLLESAGETLEELLHAKGDAQLDDTTAPAVVCVITSVLVSLGSIVCRSWFEGNKSEGG